MERHLFIMGSLTGKFVKGILGDFIFKAAVLEYKLFQKFCKGHNETINGNPRHQRTFVKVASLEKSGSFGSIPKLVGKRENF